MNILKQLFIGVVAMIAVTPSAMAQLKSVDAFTNAPMSVFPLLDKNARLDMVDYFNSGSTTATQNSLQGRSRVTDLTDNDIKIAMTDASSYQLSILPDKSNGGCIALISTVATPAPDSRITFYSPSWQQYDTKSRFEAPSMTDWLTDAGRKTPDEVTNMVPFMLASYTYDPATSTLTLTNNLKQFLSEDIYSMVAPLLRDQLVYKWNGSRMVKQK